MEGFVAACELRAADVVLHNAVASHAHFHSPLWRIDWHEGRGRVLVASEDVPPGTLIFRERPLVAAPVMDTGAVGARGEAQAVAQALMEMADEAFEMLCSPAHGLGTAEAATLATAADAFAAAFPAHDPPRARRCLGVASVNVHSASRPTRGVLGILSSMMEHDCSPSAMLTIGDHASGSPLALRTLRHVTKGEPLSVTYVVSYQPTEARRRQLRQQHGFVCGCARCETAPELVRCFACPSCHDGACSGA